MRTFGPLMKDIAWRAAGALGLIAAFGLSGNALAASGATGQGYGLEVDAGVLSGGVNLGIPLGDTGVQTAPPDFNKDKTLLGVNVSAPGLLHANAATVYGHTEATLGLNSANSTGGVENLGLGTDILLLPGLLNLTADVIHSEASATCTDGAVQVSGDTIITNLNLEALGLSALHVDGAVAPNTVLVDLPLKLNLGLTKLTVAHLKVTLNEQTVNASGNGIDVNALRLQLEVLGVTIPVLGTLTAANVDVVIGHSAAQLEDCTLIPANVTLAKALAVGSPTVATPGTQLSYTITLSNSGGQDATGYAVTDQLDSNVSFVSADHGGSESGGNVNWTGLTVPAGGTLVLGVTTEVNDPLPAGTTSIRNMAFETGGAEPDCDAGAPGCVDVPTADAPASVTLAKALAAGSPTVATPDAQLSYTITLSNSGGQDATGYAVTDRLDPNVSFVSADNSGTYSGGNVNWTGLTVPAGGTLVLGVTTEVKGTLPADTTSIRNMAFETGGAEPDCDAGAPGCVDVPVPGPASVTLFKALAAGSPTSATPGAQLSYTITLSNTGGQNATGYAVTDQLDPNVTFVSADNGGTLSGGNVNWTGLTVPAGGTLVLGVTTEVKDPLPAGTTSIRNMAFETGGTLPDCDAGDPGCVDIPTTIHAIPVNSGWMLLFLTGAIGLLAARRRWS